MVLSQMRKMREDAKEDNRRPGLSLFELQGLQLFISFKLLSKDKKQTLKSNRTRVSGLALFDFKASSPSPIYVAKLKQLSL